MNLRTIQSEFKRHGIINKKKVSPVQLQPKQKEQFSKWELEGLMGMHRDTYYRKNGSVRSR